MNKAQLIQQLSTHFEGSRSEAARALNAVVKTITVQVATGDKVSITGFGVFEKVERPARVVRNPRTGERKHVDETSIVKFRPGTDLKAHVTGLKKAADDDVATSVPAGKATAARATKRASR